MWIALAVAGALVVSFGVATLVGSFIAVGRDPEEYMKERDKELLEALQDADTALYKLWKKTEVGSPLMLSVSKFQVELLHPEIKKLVGEK